VTAATDSPAFDLRRDGLAILLLLGVAVTLFAPVTGKPFWNADDWLHLDLGAGLAAFDPLALLRAFTGETSSDACRLVPNLLWGVDFALFGLNPAGYYATNISIVLGIGLGVYGIARRRASVVPSATAASLFLFGAAAVQPLYFLGARDDSTAALLGVLAAACWPALRRRRWGIAVSAGLILLAGLSKPPAMAQVPGLIVLVELLERRRGPAVLPAPRLLMVLGGVVVLSATLLVLAVDLPELLQVSDPRGLARPDMVVRRISMLGAASVALGHGLSGLDGLRLGLVGAALLIAVLTRRWQGELLILGAGWAVLSALPILLWLLREADDGDVAGRYLLLPAVGGALLLAGTLPRLEGRGALLVNAGALALVALTAIVWVDVGREELAKPDSSSDELLEVAIEVMTRSPGAELLVGVRQPDRGTSSLLASHVWERELGPRPGVFLQGTRKVVKSTTEPYEYGRFASAESDLDLTREKRVVIWQVPTAQGLRWQVRVAGTAPTVQPVAAAPGGPLAPTRWPMHEGIPWHLVPALPFQTVSLPADLQGRCAVTLDLDVTTSWDTEPRLDAALVESGLFALASFGGDRDFFLVPLAGPSVIWLPNVAGPAPTGRSLRLVPANVPATAVLRQVSLGNCDVR